MKNVYQKKPTLPLSAHTEKWWHSRARSLPGTQWRVTQEAIAVLAGGKCNFKQTSSLFLSFPTGIMKIMMLPSYANSFKGTVQQLLWKTRSILPGKIYHRSPACWKSLRMIFYCFLFFKKNIFSCYTFPISHFSRFSSLSAPALSLPCGCLDLLDYSLTQAIQHVDTPTFPIHTKRYVTAREF